MVAPSFNGNATFLLPSTQAISSHSLLSCSTGSQRHQLLNSGAAVQPLYDPTDGVTMLQGHAINSGRPASLLMTCFADVADASCLRVLPGCRVSLNDSKWREVATHFLAMHNRWACRDCRGVGLAAHIVSDTGGQLAVLQISEAECCSPSVYLAGWLPVTAKS